MTLELSSTFLAKNNRHANAVDACVTLITEKSTMRNKTSKLMNNNLLVLNNHATTSCEGGFFYFSVMELFVLLLNYCHENLVGIFLINYSNEDPEACFEQIVAHFSRAACFSNGF